MTTTTCLFFLLKKQKSLFVFVHNLSEWKVLLLVLLSFKRVLAAKAIGTIIVYKISEDLARIFRREVAPL
jgi:hypothetical protein